MVMSKTFVYDDKCQLVNFQIETSSLDVLNLMFIFYIFALDDSGNGLLVIRRERNNWLTKSSLLD
jgi:hypothetical protein